MQKEYLEKNTHFFNNQLVISSAGMWELVVSFLQRHGWTIIGLLVLWYFIKDEVRVEIVDQIGIEGGNGQAQL